jgi:hypothetical protein
MEIILKQKADEASRTALSNALRRKKEISQISQLSGDPILSQFGQSYGGEADQQAQTFVKQREAADQRGLTQGYYDQLGGQHQDMMGFREKQLAEQKRANDLSYQASVLKQTMGKKPTDKAMESASEAVMAVENLGLINESFQDDFGKTSLMPYQGDIENWTGRRSFGSEGARKQANWWAAYQNLYELPQRNKMFGSALTDTEKQAWKDANIDPNMSPTAIRERLAVIQNLAQRALNKMAEQHAQVYDPSWVQNTYGEYYNPLVGGGGQTQPQGQAAAPSMEYGEGTNIVDWADW